MTDINNAASPREVLFSTVPAANAAGLVREVLLVGGAATLAGLVREVLMLAPPPAGIGGQTAVTINTG